MKKMIIFLMFALIVMISCKKTETTTTAVGDPGVTTVHVSAYKSNAPIAGIYVAVMSVRIDIGCDCLIYNSTEVLRTDANGNCEVENKYFKSSGYLLEIGGDEFWTVYSDNTTSKPTEYTVEFRDQLNVHLIRTNIYPDNAVIGYNCSGEQPGSTLSSYLRLAPADSVVTMDAYGAEKNTVRWWVLDNIQEDTLGSGTVGVDVKQGAATDLEIHY
jgi:hypothetical protein